MQIIELQIISNIATLSINRPRVKNALNAEAIALFRQYLTQIEKDQTIRVVIIQGQGACFSAGADLNWMRASIKLNARENEADALGLATLLQQLYTLNKPTIAKIQGAVIGGAVGLIACCDIAIASNTASFSMPELKLGLSPAVISPYVIQAIGKRMANSLMLTGEVITATRARELNLIQQVVNIRDLNHTIEQVAKQLLEAAPSALSVTKQLMQHEYRLNENVAAYTAKIIANLRTTPEAQEGITAFLEKRRPKWWHDGDI